MPSKSAELVIRNAKYSDVKNIRKLSLKIYPEEDGYPADQIRGQINHFRKGQLVALYNGEIVAYASSIVVTKSKATENHTWTEITGGGYASTHDPSGDYLYGMEIFVDPEFRRLRIGARFYREREALAKELGLQGIVFCGRMPLLRRKKNKHLKPEEYLEQVKDKKIKDPVLNFQIKNGFEAVRVIRNYYPDDKASGGHAVLMIWSNPDYVAQREIKASGRIHLPDLVRVAVVQYLQRGIKSFEEFRSIAEYFVDIVSDYKSDFVLFPELFTLQLLSVENEEVAPNVAIEHLTKYTKPIRDAFHDMAIRYNVNIIAGSHPTKNEVGEVENISYVFLRDGSIHEQAKIHPTPDERYWWNIKGGNKLEVIDTDCGPIGVLICYDSEFPELARHLANQGANILFVPFCTDIRESYLRVRYCCQARAVENQCYVAMAGNVGNLPRVQNMDIQYAQSCILTPCDFQFARDGIAADTTPNTETVVFADLKLESLYHAKHSGSVRNLKDRRHDLYTIKWGKK